MAEGKYRIVQAQLPLPAGLAHNFLVLLGPDGEVLGELHGMATDPMGNIKPIGNSPDDRLRFHEYPEGDFESAYYRPYFPQAVLIEGDQATILNRWNAGQKAGAGMNELDIQYPFFGLGKNSNSFASTLIAAMGLTEPAKRDDTRVAPGAGRLLLEPESIQNIRRDFSIAPPLAPDADLQPHGPVDAPDERTAAPPVGTPGAVIAPPRGTGIPAAKGPTSIGGPNGPAPLLPPIRSRPQAPPSRPAPAADPSPLLRYAPDVFPNYAPFGLPAPFRSDVRDGAQVAPAINGEARTSMPMLLASAFGVPTGPASAATPAIAGNGDDIGGGRIGAALAAPSSNERFLVRRPSSGNGDVAPVDAIRPQEGISQPLDITTGAPSLSPVRFPLGLAVTPSIPTITAAPPSAPGGILGLLMQAGTVDPSNPDQPPAGGLLGLIQRYVNGDLEGDAPR